MVDRDLTKSGDWALASAGPLASCVCPWKSHITALNLSLLICKMACDPCPVYITVLCGVRTGPWTLPRAVYRAELTAFASVVKLLHDPFWGHE